MDQPNEEEILLPLSTMEDIEQNLQLFLERHKQTKIVKHHVTDRVSVFRIEDPWNDPTLTISLGFDFLGIVDVLNNVVLPERLSALWHQDTKDLEVIWTAYELSDDQKEISGRKFDFIFNRKTYICEFGPASERLLKLAECSYPKTNPSTTNFRNLQSFHYLSRSKDDDNTEDLAESLNEPLCFWIRGTALPEKNLIRMIESLNFYLSYFDSKSPRVMIHDVEQDVHPQTRYRNGSFPSAIQGRSLDENLTSFWDATRNTSPMLKFIFYYRIMEYAAAHHVDANIKHRLRNILMSPAIGHDLGKAVEAVIAAFDGSKAEDVPRFNNLISACVKVEIIWREIEANKTIFSRAARFDGGFTLPPLVSKEETLETFSSGGLVKFCDGIRKIRNALVHGKDQATATVITPTAKNMGMLSAWVNLVAAAAGEVVVYGTET